MTSPTTQRFQWIDRDTAARDLLQLVYHAPSSISLRALRLLEAIRSAAVVSELQAIVYDKTRNDWERRYALRAIAAASGDIYMPELSKEGLDITCLENSYRVGFGYEAFVLAAKHPSNRKWLFEYIERYPPETQHKLLCSYSDFDFGSSDMYQAIGDRLMLLLQAHPALLDLHSVEILRFKDGRDTTVSWLAERWETIIYLCLIAEIYQIVNLIEDWEELRNIVFFSCPTIVLEYHPVRAEIVAKRKVRQKTINITKVELWQDLAKLHAEAHDGDKLALEKLERRTHKRDIPAKAAAVHFLGKLMLSPLALRRLIHFVQYVEDTWKWQDEDDPDCYVIHHPVQFEAGEALRDHPSPKVWEALISSYLINKGYDEFMLDWITYQTDILSGLEVQYTGETWNVEDRPWFQALAENKEG